MEKGDSSPRAPENLRRGGRYGEEWMLRLLSGTKEGLRRMAMGQI